MVPVQFQFVLVFVVLVQSFVSRSMLVTNLYKVPPYDVEWTHIIESQCKKVSTYVRFHGKSHVFELQTFKDL